MRDRLDSDTITRMDVLSDVLAVMRTGEPTSVRLGWHAPWAQRFPPVPGAAGFQVVLRGSCWLLAADAVPLRLAAGDVVFRPHGRGHTLADDPSTPVTGPPCDLTEPPPPPASTAGATTVTLCGAYRLDPARAHPLLADLPEIVHFPAQPGLRSDLRAVVDLLAAELDQPRLGTVALVPALLDALLTYLLRSWFDGQPADPDGSGWAAALRDPAVAAALHAMHREPERTWTVDGLAAQAGLSRAAFARRFRALLGQPPLTYLTWWRMTTAGRLLRGSDLPLSGIAGRVGYTSEFAFAAAFKRQFGQAPGRYRRAG